MITAPSITIPIKINAHQCTKQRLQAPFSFCTSDGAAILTKKEAQQCELRLIFYLYCHGSQNQRRFDLKAPYHLLTSPCTRQLASQLLIHNGATGLCGRGQAIFLMMLRPHIGRRIKTHCQRPLGHTLVVIRRVFNFKLGKTDFNVLSRAAFVFWR